MNRPADAPYGTGRDFLEESERLKRRADASHGGGVSLDIGPCDSKYHSEAVSSDHPARLYLQTLTSDNADSHLFSYPQLYSTPRRPQEDMKYSWSVAIVEAKLKQTL